MADWTPWNPIKDLSGQYFVDSLQESKDQFIIKLSNYRDGKKIQIRFQHGIDTYRYINESFCFGIISELEKKYAGSLDLTSIFFKITHSDLLKLMSKKSSGVSEAYPFIHFCIIAGDEIVDIIARYEPEVKIIQ